MTIPKPTFIIVGVGKCGTSSLWKYLDDHPDCCMSRPKEVRFFNAVNQAQPNPNYERGWRWYQQAWSHYAGESAVGEASPPYADRERSPGTPQRIHAFNPNTKIILMVRHPLLRMISGWKMQLGNATKTRNSNSQRGRSALDGFESWMIDQKQVGNWGRGRYAWQLDAFLEYFPRSEVLTTFREDWKPDPLPELRRICSFIGVDPERIRIGDPKGHNRADQRTSPTRLAQFGRAAGHTAIARRLFPAANWKSLSRRFGSVPLVIPTPSWELLICQEYLRYVREDCQRFLAEQGKSPDYWDLV